MGAFESSVILVTTAVDENDSTIDSSVGAGTSLREAIEEANLAPGISVILFSDTTDGGFTNFHDTSTDTIVLNLGELFIDSNTDIFGPGEEKLTIDGNYDTSTALGDTRLFNLDGFGVNSITVKMQGLTLANARGFGDLNDGGAIYNDGAMLEVKRVRFLKNTAVSDGGAIANFGNLIVEACTFDDNGAGTNGGAIFNRDTFGGGGSPPEEVEGEGEPEIEFEGYYGSSSGFLTFIDSTFSNNSAQNGGAISSRDGTVDGSNSTISNNVAATGGGIHLDDFTFAEFNNLTIAYNTATNSSAGGGIFIDTNDNAEAVLDACIVAGNESQANLTSPPENGQVSAISAPSFLPNDIEGDVDTLDSDGNLVGDAFTSGGLMDGTNFNIIGNSGSGTIDTTTIILSLADNGGPTLTHALAPASPAIDASQLTTAFDTNGQLLANDQRGPGFPRAIDGDNDNSAIVDMGAFELDADTTPPVITLIDNTTIFLECDNFGGYGGGGFIDPGAIALDNVDGDISSSIVVGGDFVDVATLGTYLVTYDVTDSSGNAAAQVTRTVIVEDTTNPLAICWDTTIQLDASGDASISPFDIDAGSTDNCGIFSYAIDTTVFTCADVGPNTVTLTVFDESGNQDSCMATVTVVDDTPPIAICQNITVQLDATGNVTITAAEIDNGSNDACGLASISVSPASFNCSNIGPNNVTLTATDVNGNMSTCTAVVTVEDNLQPVAVCQNITVQLDSSGNATITAFDVDAGSADNCSIASINVSPDSFDCSNLGPNNVTLTVMDGNGNSSNCTATVTVEDDTPPTITLLGDNPLLLDEGDTYTDPGATTNDNCSISGSVIVGGDTVNTAIPGTYVVTYDVMDTSGNAAVQVSRQVIVCPATVYVDQSADFQIDFDATPAGLSIGDMVTWASTVNGPVAGLTFGNDAFTSVQEAIDAVCEGGTVFIAEGLYEEGAQIEIAKDVTIIGDHAETTELSGDNSHRVMEISSGDVTLREISMINGMTTNDGGGIFQISGDLTLEDCLISDNTAVNGGGIRSDGTLTITRSGFIENTAELAGGIFMQGASLCQITDSMISGNEATVFSGGGIFRAIGELTVRNTTITQNSANLVGGGFLSAIGDSAMTFDQCTFDSNSSTNGGGAIFNLGVLTVANSTLHGNTSSRGAGIFNTTNGLRSDGVTAIGGIATVTNSTISGNTATGRGGGIFNEEGAFFPEDPHYSFLYVENSTVFGNSSGNEGGGIFNRSQATIDNSIIAGNTATNNGPDVFDSGVSMTSNNANFIGDPSGAGTAFNADLNFGNTSTTIADVLDVNLSDNGGSTFTHALAVGSPALDSGDNADIPADVLDLNGNMDTTEAVPFDQRGSGFDRLINGLVDIGAYEEQVDVTPPIITLIDNTTIFIECDQFGYEEEEEGGFFDPGATAFDNVDGDISSSIVVGGDEVDIATLGTYFITYDVSDSSGNAAQTVTRAVIVEDTTPPTAICRDTTVQLDASGFASLSPFDIDAGSDDNCGIFDYTIDTTTFTCHDVGPNTVTLTVFDESGNQDSCMATVTVVDDTPPVAICQNITVQLGSSGSVTITGFDVDGGSTDNCSIASINVSPDSFNCTNLGPNNVTLTVIDASGNSSNCTATVTVEDVTDPVITCPADTTVECDADMSPASTGFATAVDNCTANLTITFQDLTTPSTGSNFTITRTWTATDASGNSASCDQMITVQDTMPPVVTCPADIVVDNDPGQCGAVVSFMASATDTCDPAPMTSAVPASGTFFPVGTTQVTVTATDANGNQSQCTFDVTVNDNEDPVVTCPSDITTNIDPGQFGAVVTFSPAGAMDNCPGVNISQTGGLTSGSFFPVGTSSVTYTATDAAGNQSSCSFDVTVNVPYSYSVAGTSQNEGDSGTTDFVFTITRTLDSGFSGNTSIPFSIFQSGPTPFDEGDVSGSASGGGTLEFTGTETTKMVTILVNGDEEFEADEDLEFRVGDFDASTGTLDEFLRTSTTVQILNDDDLTVSISSNMNIAIEPDSPTTIDGLMSFGPQFTITRNGTFGDQDVTIELDGTSTASYPADFNLVAGYNVSIPLSGHPVSGTVTIPDGESQVDIYIDAIDDFAAEVEESVDLTILGEESYSIGSGSGSSAIAQNDYGVTNLNDFNLITNPTTGGEGTLRRAIDNAKAGLMEGLILDSSPEEGGEEEGDGIVASSMFYTSFTVPVVVFEPGLTGEITLMYGPLYIDTNDMDIQGPGADIICVSGDANENDISDIGDSRVFVVSDMYNSLVIDIFSLAIKEGYYPMGNGGAIYNNENLLLDNCVVSDSMANNGGGIRNDYLLFVNDCTFMNNMATIYGGGIDNADQLSVTNSTIKGNSASFGGGIEDIGFCTVENSILKDNSATQSGGGFDCFGATSTIINSTISGNTAGFGAGAFNEQGTLACIQCTIAENTANSFVGGILSSSNAPLPETTIHNTIVAGNTEDQSIPGSDFPSDLATANPSYVNVDPMSSNNLIGDAATAGGLSNMINGNIVGNGGTGVLPLMNIVLPLGDFGGSTEVYPLAQSSPAINAGNNLLALGANAFPLENDQRGDTFPRIVGGTVDIGAYERNIGGLRILAFEKLLGGTATIEWLSEPGVEYEVLRSTDLSMWTVISGTVTATAGRTSYTDLTPPTPKAYYIVRRKVTMVP
ncbi:MAG: HYR domain-containing protein [Verrucomicrobiota bacterium]